MGAVINFPTKAASILTRIPVKDLASIDMEDVNTVFKGGQMSNALFSALAAVDHLEAANHSDSSREHAIVLFNTVSKMLEASAVILEAELELDQAENVKRGE